MGRQNQHQSLKKKPHNAQCLLEILDIKELQCLFAILGVTAPRIG